MPDKLTKGSVIKWIVTIGFPLGILLIPLNEVFTSSIRLFISMTMFAILVFAFENINQTAMAILLPMLYIVFKLATPAIAFSPWAANTPWMFLGGLMLAVVLDRIGLLKRIAYKAILLTGATYNGILYGLGLAGIILNVIVPAQAVVPIVTLAFGICKALNLGNSKEAAGIMLTGVTVATTPTLMLFTGNYSMLAVIGEDVTGPVTLGWFECFLKNGVTFIYLLAIIFVFSKIFKPANSINGRDFFLSESRKLGKISRDELKALCVCGILFILLLTIKYHGIQAGWLFGMLPILLFFPGINVGTNNDLQKLNYGFVIFICSCMTIGSVANSLGLGELVSKSALPILAQQSSAFALMFIWFLCVVLNFLLTPLAIIAAFTAPFAQIAVDLNINPNAVYFAMLHGMDQLILPYENAFYLVCFSFGIVSLKDFMKGMAAKLIVNGIFVCLILLPFWKLIDFIALK